MSNIILEQLNEVLSLVDPLGRKVEDFVDEFMESSYYYTIFKRKIKVKKKHIKIISVIQKKNLSGTFYSKLKLSTKNYKHNKKVVKKLNEKLK